jgi:hypothetical protein
MVTGSSYRSPGQCRKVKNLRRVQLVDRKILVCAHHDKVLNSGGIKSVITTKKPRRGSPASWMGDR